MAFYITGARREPTAKAAGRKKDLEEYLAGDLSASEDGLKVYQKGEIDGRQFPLDDGIIDILAIDARGRLTAVVIAEGRAGNAVFKKTSGC